MLYGVTGSGKTEVYLQLIEKVLKIGKNAIVLVPEISLTPQMLDRFISRFGKSDIAILHSKLSIGERHDEWERIREKKARIVIGARSAIFAPIENIGIIIIDEEHDSSYKSETNPRYNAKEIAKILAKENKAPLLLGSATPDINTFYNATNEDEEGNTKIQLLTLTKRANQSSLPKKVEIIDLKQELANGNRSMLSMELYNSIEENIKQKRQTILFLNRRGYSTFIMCRNCGYTVKCPNCNISMTYHSYEKKLKCHYCSYEENLVTICPECHSDKIRYFGTGTQKLEQEINKQFPNAKKLKCHYCSYEENLVTICPECHSDKIRYFGTGTQKLEQEINKQFPNASTIRMDIDTVTKKNSHEEILNKFKNENIDILIGTQMVVKGHHFPNVTLVGVIAADSSLNIDDYRANERTFQILTQVAGRAGREKLSGKVIIQTYNPDNFSIICAQKQNYEMFYETEIALRKQLKYPPFCDIILISFNGLNEYNIKNISNEMYKKLLEKLNQEEFKIFRPMPSPIDKIQNRYRWRIIIKGNMTVEANKILNQTLKEIYTSCRKSRKRKFTRKGNNTDIQS